MMVDCVDCWCLLHLPHLPHPKFHPILEVDKLVVSIHRFVDTDWLNLVFLFNFDVLETKSQRPSSNVLLKWWHVHWVSILGQTHTRCFTLVMCVGLYYHHEPVRHDITHIYIYIYYKSRKKVGFVGGTIMYIYILYHKSNSYCWSSFCQLR